MQGSPPTYKSAADDLNPPGSPVAGGNGGGGPFAGLCLDPGLSPGGGGPVSPSTPLSGITTTTSSRPQPARSPYEWMKKPSYQSQPEKNGESEQIRIGSPLTRADSDIVAFQFVSHRDAD